MRAREFIIEGNTGSLSADVAAAVPGAYVIPSLKNNDFYEQYRFGVALAAAKAEPELKKEKQNSKFDEESVFGENEIVIAYTGATDESIMNKALQMMGRAGDAKLVSTKGSNEGSDIPKQSPVKGFKGYQRGPKKK